MAEPARLPSRSYDSIKTYRYLRIGMVGAVLLLAISIGIEALFTADCLQTSISAYYYTPVRAIFVGGLFTVGLSLIVYKGESPWEDALLTMAGMLVPLVAIFPTINVGECWSVIPEPLPVRADGSLAPWVTANISNNFYSLVAVAVFGSIASVGIKRRSPEARKWHPADYVLALFIVLLLLGGMLARLLWPGFDTAAHAIAALGFFIFLTLAVFAAAHNESKFRWGPRYKRLGISMFVGGILFLSLGAIGPPFWPARFGAEYWVLVLEAYEIVLFGIYWAMQTKDKWGETDAPTSSAILQVSSLDDSAKFFVDTRFDTHKIDNEIAVSRAGEVLFHLREPCTLPDSSIRAPAPRYEADNAPTATLSCYLYLNDVASLIDDWPGESVPDSTTTKMNHRCDAVLSDPSGNLIGVRKVRRGTSRTAVPSPQ